jgi:hypothetical protein
MDRSIDRRTRALTAHRRAANSILEFIDKQAHRKLMPERAARNRTNGQYCSLGTATIIFNSTV